MRQGTALITGGKGFIGRVLVRQLERSGWRVSVLDQMDGNGPSALSPECLGDAVRGFNVVYHLAGVLGTTELNDMSAKATNVNILGTVNVLDACVHARTPRVFLCTKPNDWLNTYSITKKASEQFGQLYADRFGLDVRILRWLNAYGPGQKTHPVRKVVPTMLLQALYGRPIEVFGSGQQPVDLIHVDDLARITVNYVNCDAVDSSVRDTGLSVRLTVNELALLIRDIAASGSEIIHLPMRRGEDESAPVVLLDSASAADVLGLREDPIDVRTGLQACADYYRTLPEPHAMSALASYSDCRRIWVEAPAS